MIGPRGSLSTRQWGAACLPAVAPTLAIALALLGALAPGPSTALAAGPQMVRQIASTSPRLVTAAATPISLPDGRAWEMVSPIDKNGGEIQGFEANFGGDVLQASPDGSAVTYTSRTSFADPRGAPPASQYLSRRGATGWTTENISAQTKAGAYGDQPDGVPFQLFSPGLDSALMLNGCSSQPCLRSYSQRDDSSGGLSPLPFGAADLNFAGASPDLSSELFASCRALTGEATEVETPAGGGGACDPASANLYDYSGGQLRLVNNLTGPLAGPFAALAARRGAVSESGSRIYWTQAGDLLYIHEGQANFLIAEGAEFEGAGADGRFAFYLKNGRLFRFDAQSRQSSEYDLAPHGGGAGAGGLQGFVGASGDGSYVYYVGLDGALYLRHGADDVHIAAAIDPGSFPPASGTARLSGDGTRLLFLSSVQLTPYDNRDAKTGQPDPELYLYAGAPEPSQGTLTCVSCNPSGARPTGSASIPGTIANGSGEAATRAYQPRTLVAAGRRVFFDSFDALAPHDTNQDRDVYQWEASGEGGCEAGSGCIGLISSGTAEGGATFIDASADGSDAFFLTDGSLVAEDPGKVDLYDARVGGGFPPAKEDEICAGDDCQPLPPGPEDPTPGSMRPSDPNPPLLRDCRKGTVRKQGKCVKKKAHPKKKAHHRRRHGAKR